MADATAAPRCRACAQPAKALKCSRCKMPYCSVACQVLDWKERGHKATCLRLVEEAAARGEAPTPPPQSPKPKWPPPVVAGPARGYKDIARAKAAAAMANAAAPAAPEPEHWSGSPRCPICLDDWDVNAEDDIFFRVCCCRNICIRCENFLNMTIGHDCPFCRTPQLQSIEEFLDKLRSHVENGNPAAICYLGQYYRNGELGLQPPYNLAARLYQRAADLGDVVAMFNLAFDYAHGRGVKLDKKEAVTYYRMAADRGHTRAQYFLAHCLEDGDGVTQDDAEALRLYKLAAEQGLTDAECAMAGMYEDGHLVACDRAEATRWYERAAAKGDPYACDALARLRGR